MSNHTVEFRTITSLSVEAIGKPGERTFRILVRDAQGSATIWLEKDQLLQLALAVDQMITSLPDIKTTQMDSQEKETGSVQLEFKAGRLILGHDDSSGRFVIDAHDIDAGEKEPATVRLWNDPSQAKKFADEAMDVCAAGRPLCSLCGDPIDKNGHICLRTNGHRIAPL